MDGQALRPLIESEGPEPVARKLISMLWDDDSRLSPEHFSLRELWEGFIGPVGQTLSLPNDRSRLVQQRPLIEAMTAGTFNALTGNIIARAVETEYNRQPMISDQLVDTVASSSRHERYVGMQAWDPPEDVNEGEEYPEVGSTDKAIMGPEPAKRGFKISVTEEAVIFDKTGLILRKARGASRNIQIDREKHNIKTVQDLAGYLAYYPEVSGAPTQTALYRTSAAGAAWYNRTINSLASTALQDWSDVDAAMQLFYAMTDEQGESIDPITGSFILLVPRGLWATLLRIVGATQTRETTNTDTVTVAPDILKLMGAGIIPLTSPHMDSATTWFLGDFKAQFVEQEIFPIQTVQLPPQPEKDIVSAFRVRRKARVHATDDKFVLKVTA